jgi:hypothetical protein
MTVRTGRLGCCVFLAVTIVAAPPAFAKQADRAHAVAGTWQTLVPVSSKLKLIKWAKSWNG